MSSVLQERSIDTEGRITLPSVFLISLTVPEPILHQVATGDTDAVRECISRYGNLIWSIANRFLPNRAEAEDAVQEVFIKIWKNADQYDSSKASEQTFIGTIARRHLIDILRKKERRPATGALQPIDIGEIDVDRLEQADEYQQVKSLWTELVPEQQKVLSLSIHEGLSYPQIAEQLSIPLGTVKTRARLGLKALREKYTARNADHSNVEASS